MIAIAFQLINFLLVIFLIRYAFKRFALQAVKDQIKRKKQDELDLQTKAGSLEARLENMVVDIAVQDRLAIRLLEKVKNWQKSFGNKRAEQQEALEGLQKDLSKLATLQSNNVRLEQESKKILAQAVENANEKLIAKFADKKAARSYLSSTVSILKESK